MLHIAVYDGIACNIDAAHGPKEDKSKKSGMKVLRSGTFRGKVGQMQRTLLSGEFDHTLDDKGRVTLPARYREYFQEGVVLVRFQDKEPCVRVYHPDAWSEFDGKYLEPLDVFGNEADSWTTRSIYRNQDRVELDRQGRILLPPKRIQELGLSGKIKILGNRTHLEIWDPATLAGLEADKEKELRERQDA
jgi:MraZ protein